MTATVVENETPSGADSASYGVTAIINPSVNDEGTLVINTDPNDEGTYAVSENTDLQTLIDEIKADLQEMREGQVTLIFSVGKKLREAKEDGIGPKNYEIAVKQSGLHSISNANNYIRVSDNGRFTRRDIRDHLPVTVGALIDLVKWSEDELRKCIAAGVLHPDATRGELRGWISEHRGKRKGNTQHPKTGS